LTFLPQVGSGSVGTSSASSSSGSSGSTLALTMSPSLATTSTNRSGDDDLFVGNFQLSTTPPAKRRRQSGPTEQSESRQPQVAQPAQQPRAEQKLAVEAVQPQAQQRLPQAQQPQTVATVDATITLEDGALRELFQAQSWAPSDEAAIAKILKKEGLDSLGLDANLAWAKQY
jgi:hypothetical protein